MTDVATPSRLWKLTWPRAALIAGLALTPTIVLGWWRVAAGLTLGCLLLLGSEFVLSCYLGRSTTSRRWTLLVLLALLHNVLAGAVMLAALKTGLAHPLGLAAGASMPALATASLLLARR